jgi:mono/diheme cytochrome c family protein
MTLQERAKIMIVICACGLAFTGPALAGNPEAGRFIAQSKCAGCHAIGKEGASPLAAAPPFRTFAKKWPIEHLQEALAEGIAVGHEAMPEFTFEPEEVSDIIAYLLTVQEKLD